MLFSREKEVCECTGTTDKQIKKLVRSGRVKDLDDLVSITGVTTGCGGCDVDVTELLNKFRRK